MEKTNSNTSFTLTVSLSALGRMTATSLFIVFFLTAIVNNLSCSGLSYIFVGPVFTFRPVNINVSASRCVDYRHLKDKQKKKINYITTTLPGPKVFQLLVLVVWDRCLMTAWRENISHLPVPSRYWDENPESVFDDILNRRKIKLVKLPCKSNART